MSVKLKYQHQQKTYELMKEKLEISEKTGYIYPTGCGSIFPVLKYIEENKTMNSLVIVPTNFIFNKYLNYIRKNITNGKKKIEEKKITLITYKKLNLLLQKVQNLKPDIVIFDDAHKIEMDIWNSTIDKFMEKYPKTKYIAIAETLDRIDKNNMLYKKFGDNIVYEISLIEALSAKKEVEIPLRLPIYLSILSELSPMINAYKIRINKIEDIDKKETLIKKYDVLENIIRNSSKIQDIMLQGIEKKNGKYIIFCEDEEDLQEKMKNAQMIFGKINNKIYKDYILAKDKGSIGKTPAENRKTLENFEEKAKGKELNLLFCVDMPDEKINIENINGEVMFKKTESAKIYKQQIEKVIKLTEKDEKTIIIDAVNNWLRQIESFKEIENAIIEGKAKKIGKYESFSFNGVEIDFFEVLKEIKEETNYNYYNVYDEIIEWLDTHKLNIPRETIKLNEKELKTDEMTEEEIYEVNLYTRWCRSKEKKILDKYEGKLIKEVPEEYREKIEKLREYGLGIKKDIYYEIIKWLRTNSGKLPRAVIYGKEEKLKPTEMTEEEKYEIDLYKRWFNSKEKNILDETEGIPIEKVEEEYREKIKKLRELGLTGNKKTYFLKIAKEKRDNSEKKNIKAKEIYKAVQNLADQAKKQSNE